MIGPDSRILEIWRDFPYYKIVFANTNSDVSIITLFDIVTNKVKVVSVTSEERASIN